MKLVSADLIRIEKYGKTRFWGIWIGSELLAVVCYKKGALAIRETLLQFSETKKKLSVVQFSG